MTRPYDENERFSLAIVSPLEAELVTRIAQAFPDIDVRFEPDLLPPTRYVCDHRGDPNFTRDELAQRRWNHYLDADVWFGVPGDTAAGLTAAVPHAPRLRFVQSTAAGAGELVHAANFDAHTLGRIAFASAAGVHGAMLAEFFFYGLLALRKASQRLAEARAQRRWDHFAMGELAGATLAVVGLGGIGSAIAVRGRAFDMHVIGLARSDAARDLVDELLPMSALAEAAARADAFVITLPGTPQTRGIIDGRIIAALRPDAVFGNVGRGTLVDQPALIEALESGRVAGAVLDVVDPEPLPPENPLWTMPNVIFAPHTAALSVHENERIVELFCDNLRRLIDGRSLRNLIDTQEFH